MESHNLQGDSLNVLDGVVHTAWNLSSPLSLERCHCTVSMSTMIPVVQPGESRRST